MLKDIIKNNLARLARVPVIDESLVKAAVVIVVVKSDKDEASPHILLTRRAAKLRKHSGQFALPGGKVDVGETSTEAALRELGEELGIEVDEQDVLGLLDDYPTRSGFCITPVVVWAGEPERISPNPDEVAKVFEIPLNDLSNQNLVNLDPGKTAERPVLSINLTTIGHEVYAPTAAIIFQFYEAAIMNRQTRVAFYDEPEFAWT